MPELVIELDAVEVRELKLEHLETALPSLGDAIELRHAAGRHSNRNELATEFGVSPGHIKEIVGGRERVNG